jgi:hypothetical protein
MPPTDDDGKTADAYTRDAVALQAEVVRPDLDLDELLGDAPQRPPFTFRFGGQSFTISGTIDVRMAAAIDAGRLDDGLRLLLGAEQYRRLQECPGTFGAAHLKAVLDSYDRNSKGPRLGES